MKISELKKLIEECCNDIVFVYKGKNSGITSEVHDSVPRFYVWYGLDIKEFSNVDELIDDPFFEGNTIRELVDIIEISIV